MDADSKMRRTNFLNHLIEVYDVAKTTMRQNFPSVEQRLYLKVKFFEGELEGQTIYKIDELPLIVDHEVCSQAYMWLIFKNAQGEKEKLIFNI